MSKEGSIINNQAAKRVAFFLGLLLFGFLLFGLTKEVVNRRQIDRQLADYQSRINKLTEENKALSDKIDSWGQSGELEANARLKLGLERPGEKTIMIIRDQSDSIDVAIKTNQEKVILQPNKLAVASESNIQKWWQYFFQ